MGKIDLHAHTTASDGKSTPEDLVRLASAKGLKALAITDHDSVSGIAEAIKLGSLLQVEIVPGIEVSTAHQGHDIHILGYYLNYEDEQLKQDLEALRETRNRRNQLMIAKLNELGIEITYAEVAEKQKTKDGNIGRPHIAEVLIDKKIVATTEEAFSSYLGKDGRAFINPPRISPIEGIELILKYGGIPVLAHPGLYNHDELIGELVQAGLIGMEVYHPDHSPIEREWYLKIAKEYDLIVTGGSDYHGISEGIVFHADLGSEPVPPSALAQLKAAKKS